MDDFQHRLVAALERLAGRGGPVLDDRLVELDVRIDALVTGQALVATRLAQIRERLEDIRDRLPPPGP